MAQSSPSERTLGRIRLKVIKPDVGMKAWPARLIAIGVLLTLPFAAFCAGLTLAGSRGLDWEIYATAAYRAWSGEPLYVWTGDYAYVYSPLFAYLFAGVSWLGLDVWRFAHVVAGLLMPTWAMKLLVLVSWPFWFEMQYGNLVVFVLLAAAWAIRGSRPAQIAFLFMAVLMPRPLMVPIAGWLLWTEPRLRWPFVVMATGSVIFAAATGHLAPWVMSLLDTPDVANASDVNFGPSRLIGPWWLLIGVPLGAWFALAGRLGLASLAVSPYILPQYFLMAFLEFIDRQPPGRMRHASGHPPHDFIGSCAAVDIAERPRRPHRR